MKSIANLQFLFAALYAWLASVFVGAVILDIVYFDAASRIVTPDETIELFMEAADFLLLLLALTLLAGAAAIAATWKAGPARNLLLASFLLVVAEFLVPVLFFDAIEAVRVSLGFNAGPWVRLTLSSLSSLIAFLGLWKLYSRTVS
jgi:hypothetical protein